MEFIDSLKREIGRGPSSTVVEAHDQFAVELVAIKIGNACEPLTGLSTRWFHGGQGDIRCVTIRDGFLYRGHLFLVMDLLGPSLGALIRGGSFSSWIQADCFIQRLLSDPDCKFPWRLLFIDKS